VADLGPEAMIFELVGPPDVLDSFEELVRPYGVKELVRTGRIALPRAASRRTPRPQHVLR
jgi:acetolactate synthase I/III small subunit